MSKTKFKNRIKELRTVKAGDLKPNPKNWRLHPDSQKDAVVSILKEVGYANALIARELKDGSLELIDGHLRADIDKDAEVPVLIVDLTQKEADLVLATIDPLAGMAETNTELLSNLLSSSGFGDEMEGLLSTIGENYGIAPPDKSIPEPQVDKTDELQDKWQVKTGDLWTIGKHRLLCGDCLEVMADMDDNSVDLVLTDPPYGINVIGGSKSFGSIGGSNIVLANNYNSIVNDDVKVDLSLLFTKSINQVIFGGNYFNLPISKGWIVWDKKCKNDWDDNFSDGELAWTSFDKPLKIIRHLYMGLMKENKEEIKRVHPTQKPIRVIEWVIEKYSNQSDLILDPFLGSGTTMVASESLGRICYGMEIEPKYCAVTLERMSEMGLKPKLI